MLLNGYQFVRPRVNALLFSHQGSRDEQQDAAKVGVIPNISMVRFALADGMGGHAGGAAASKAAVQEGTRPTLSRHSRASLQAGQQLASDLDRAVRRSGPGGTTWLSADVRDDDVRLCWCGDTSAILLRPGHGLVKSTRSHSVGDNRLFTCLGEPNRNNKPELESSACEFGRDDLLLLYTDGCELLFGKTPTLSNPLSDPRQVEFSTQPVDPRHPVEVAKRWDRELSRRIADTPNADNATWWFIWRT